MSVKPAALAAGFVFSASPMGSEGLIRSVSCVTVRRDLSHSKVVVEASKGKLR